MHYCIASALHLFVYCCLLLQQVRVLLRRTLTTLRRDPLLAILHTALSIVVGVIAGAAFSDVRTRNEETNGITDRYELN
jgi:hypothetical protein